MMTMAEIKMTIAEKLEVIATEMTGYTFEDGMTIEEFVADRKAKLIKKEYHTKSMVLNKLFS